MITAKDQISKHFHGDEFACPCCNVVKVDELLLEGLESLHTLLDVSIHILSGYRCESHNRYIGGEENSQHCLGKAADIRVLSSVPLQFIYKTAHDLQRFGGIGIYPAGAGQLRGFLHVDVRKNSARWSRINGVYLSVNEGLNYLTSNDGRH